MYFFMVNYNVCWWVGNVLNIYVFVVVFWEELFEYLICWLWLCFFFYELGYWFRFLCDVVVLCRDDFG